MSISRFLLRATGPWRRPLLPALAGGPWPGGAASRRNEGRRSVRRQSLQGAWPRDGGSSVGRRKWDKEVVQGVTKEERLEKAKTR